jgi:hypothetical protein
MSFKITWNVARIIGDLRAAAAQAGNRYNDGFTAWGCKQDLLQVKYELERMLRSLPTFEGEDEYCREQEKQNVWQALKHK